MSDVCPECEGAGMVLSVNAAGVRVVRVCACEEAAKRGYRVSAAQIPMRHRHCSLESFETNFRGAHPSLKHALRTAQKFVQSYPVETDGKGLLLTGPIGVGKTHLAVGILMGLIQERGARVLFCDYRELLKQIQRSYDRSTHTTELGILAPVFEAEVLVLDELGAQKPTDWVWDTVGLILNTRYKDKRTTIITTNYEDLPPISSGEFSDAQKAAREDTLGDRVGERIRSRIAEMCVRVEMDGKDFRFGPKRASFG